MSSIPHVVIVGGGFGGITAASELSGQRVRITLIDRANHHLFQPLLYQVATCGLSPSEIAYPIRSIFRGKPNVNVLLEQVTSVDLQARVVHTARGEMSYDYLILAMGAENNYFGHDDWAKYAIGLKDIDDAVEIRRRVLLAFEAAEREPDAEKRQALLTFVVIGGGPTGVELAGSLAELARHALSADFRTIKPSAAKIILLEGSDRILGSLPEDLSASATEQLARLGVEVRTKTMVSDITAHGVILKEGTIASSTVLWCAGVRATPVARTLGVELDKAGRVVVGPDLSIPGHREAFAVGDMAVFLHQTGKPLPGLAPVAMQQGRAVARSISRLIAGAATETFHYVHRGSLSTIGRSSAVADFGKLKLSGLPAWLSWLIVHIFFLIGFRNRLVVMFDWIWSYFTYQRGARLITGKRLDPGPPSDDEPRGGGPC